MLRAARESCSEIDRQSPKRETPPVKISSTPRRAIALVVGALLCAPIFVAPRAVHATVLNGCVTPADAGVAHLVGWVDVGVLLGVADPEPPVSMKVIAPDGTVTEYRDGVGLIAATEALPIWFALAEQTGDYQLANGEERCTVYVGDELGSVPTAYPEGRRQADTGLNWWLTLGGLVAGAALGFTFARRKQSV